MTNDKLADTDFRRLLLRDILAVHKLRHADIADEVGCSVSTVHGWASWGPKAPVPERIIAELVRRYPTPWSRRQMSAVPADARVGGIPALGACHYCLAVVDPPRRWCNATCRSVWLQDERDLGVEWGDVGE